MSFQKQGAKLELFSGNPLFFTPFLNREIFSLFSATQTGRFDSSGPLDGFKDIEAFKDSTVVDTVDGEFAGAYVTIFALDKNGDA